MLRADVAHRHLISPIPGLANHLTVQPHHASLSRPLPLPRFTMDVLSALPHDIDHVRQTLFTLPLPFSLNTANHELFWSLINNIYSIRQSDTIGFRKRDCRREHVRHRVICRFKRSRAVPSASQGKRASLTKRAIIGCNISFNLLAFSNHFEYYSISQLQDGDLITCTQHSHSLDKSDANTERKRNSFLRKLVGAEVTKGYHPAAIIGSLTGAGRADARTRLAAAGGAYLSRQDVINTGLTWRLANPNRL